MWKLPPIVVKVPICPTNPDVPIPAPSGLFVILKTTVLKGPVIAPARVGGTSIYGFLIIFDICSIEVPTPCATRPPTPLSRKLMTAKPIICAQQPAVAAPAAKPDSPSIMQSAALEIGAVRASPTITEITIPNANGCHSVAVIITLPRPFINFPMAGPTRMATTPPLSNVNAGVTIISTFVSFDTSLPISAPAAAAMKAPAGPPAAAPIIPVTLQLIITSAGALSPNATATPIAAPISSIALPPIVISVLATVVSPKRLIDCCPIVFKIRPTKSEQKSPIAIAESAS